MESTDVAKFFGFKTVSSMKYSVDKQESKQLILFTLAFATGEHYELILRKKADLTIIRYVNRGIEIFLMLVGITALILGGIWLMSTLNYSPRTQMIAAPSTSGVFCGQVVDALSLDPITNATVYFCQDTDFNSLVTVVKTDSNGNYKTPNITLESNFHISTKAEGYYTQPLKWSYEHSYSISKFLHYISPTKLHKISHSYNAYLEFYNRGDTPLIADEFSNITIRHLYKNENYAWLCFELNVVNTEEFTSLVSPYGEMAHYRFYVADSSVFVYPKDEGNLLSDLHYGYQQDLVSLRPLSGRIEFAEKGQYKFNLLIEGLSFRTNISFYVIVE